MELLRGILIGFAVIGIGIGIVIWGTHVEKQESLRTWNGGIHENCGGKWKIFSASQGRYEDTLYFYRCEKCDETFETRFHMKK